MVSLAPENIIRESRLQIIQPRRHGGTEKLKPGLAPCLCLRGELTLCFGRSLLADALADGERHLAGFLVGIDDHVIAV